MDAGKNKLVVINHIAQEREQLFEIFREEFDVLEAWDIAKAEAILKKEHISAVLIKLCMPGKTGWRILEFMHQNQMTEILPVLLLVSNIEECAMEKAYEMGAMEILEPPFIKTVALKRVQNLIHIWEHKVEAAKFKEEANTDPLTRLLNRRALEYKIKRLLERGDLKKSALCLLDIDNFKCFNDQYGHSFGDKVLINISNQLERIILEGDLVGRVGGDEFVLFLKNIASEQSVQIRMQEICRVFMEEYQCKHISSSIGVALYPTHGMDYQTLFSRSDKALYQAKNAGKNQCVIFKEEFRTMPYRSSVSEVESDI